MKSLLLSVLAVLVFQFLTPVVYAQTATPTPIYTCKKTCITERVCDVLASAEDNGTCPRAEVCCDQVSQTDVTPPPTPVITPLTHYRCSDFKPTEYHPLRPYAGSPCASEMIPIKDPEALDSPDKQYLAFSCGKSANAGGTITYPAVVPLTTGYDTFPENPVMCSSSPPSSSVCPEEAQAYYSDYHYTNPIPCADFATSRQLCSMARVVLDVTLDYTDAIFPILGNTKDRKLSDRNKINNYLSWYLNGTVLQAEGLPLENSDGSVTEEVNEDRLINFSGPVLKLLPEELQNRLRQTLRSEAGDTVHNYLVNSNTRSTIGQANPNNALFEMASQEDVTGEVIPELVLSGQPTEPDISGRIVRISLSLGNADNRLYFPHLKNSAVLSELLTYTYKPIGVDAPLITSGSNLPVNACYTPGPLNSCLSGGEVCSVMGPNFGLCCNPPSLCTNPIVPTSVPPQLQNPEFVSQVFTRLQGIDDDTPTFYPNTDNLTNRSTRNTELPGNPPLFTNYADRFSTINSQICDISGANPKPGDSLIGSRIPARLTYYQLVRYTPERIVPYDTAGICSFWGLSRSSYPSCVEYPVECSVLPGGVCQNNTGEGDEGNCCWGSCPYYSECEYNSTNNECKGSCSWGESDITSTYSCENPAYRCCQPPTSDICIYEGTTPPEPDEPSFSAICQSASSSVDSCLEAGYCNNSYSNDGSYDCDLVHANESSCNYYSDGRCVWVDLDCNYIYGQPITPPTPTCPAWPTQEVNTAARIAIFVKTPFVEKLYDTLVSSPDSLLRRFLPKDGGLPTRETVVNPVCFRDPRVPDEFCSTTTCSSYTTPETCMDMSLPLVCCVWGTPFSDDFLKTGNDALPGAGVVEYSAEPVSGTDPGEGVTINDPRVTAGRGGSPVLYFPKIGSLYDYMLGGGKDSLNLQCLLRPQGYCNALSRPSLSGSACTGEAFNRIAGLPEAPYPLQIAEDLFYMPQPTDPQGSYFERLIPEVLDAYAQAETETGVPCEVLAGIHYVEAGNSVDQDLQSGASLGERTLAESAIAAAHELKEHACPPDEYDGVTECEITDIQTLVRALSRYNGGGNRNCQAGQTDCALTRWPLRCGMTVGCATDEELCRCTPGLIPEVGSCRSTCRGYPYKSSLVPNPGLCPIPEGFDGFDDPYVTSFWQEAHSIMYILYPLDCTSQPANPLDPFDRMGSLTFSLIVHRALSGLP